MRPLQVLLVLLLSLGCGGGAAGGGPADGGANPGVPRNLVLFVSEDQGTVLGCYGAEGVQTPRLDALAGEGRRFTRAYAPAGVCTPSRTTLYTGLMPHRHGATGFGPVSPDVRVWGEWLGEAGLRTGLIGKLGAKPIKRFPFDFMARSNNRDESSRTLAWHLEQLDAFLAEDDGRPFCLVVNFRDSHWPFPTDGAPVAGHEWNPHSPADVVVPPELLDAAPVRFEIARFYDGLRRMDATLGAMVDRLDAQGLMEETLCLFTSDNGPPMPLAKTTLYEAGIHMPLIAFGAGTAPGVDDHFVGFVDLLPTALEIARGEGARAAGDGLDGQSILGLVGGETPEWRGQIFGSHDGHRMEPSVPSRSVRFRNWKYIRTWGQGLRFQNLVMQTSDTWAAMGAAAAAGDEEVAARMERLMQRPDEELFDLASDPRELVNLAGDPDRASVLKEARRRIMESDWLTLPGPIDPGKDTGK